MCAPSSRSSSTNNPPAIHPFFQTTSSDCRIVLGYLPSHQKISRIKTRKRLSSSFCCCCYPLESRVKTLRAKQKQLKQVAAKNRVGRRSLMQKAKTTSFSPCAEIHEGPIKIGHRDSTEEKKQKATEGCFLSPPSSEEPTFLKFSLPQNEPDDLSGEQSFIAGDAVSDVTALPSESSSCVSA